MKDLGWVLGLLGRKIPPLLGGEAFFSGHVGDELGFLVLVAAYDSLPVQADGERVVSVLKLPFDKPERFLKQP